MTEEQWDACTDPQEMLAFLREGRRPSERRDRLFAAACFRRLSPLLTSVGQWAGIDTLEEMAEGTVTPEKRRRAATATRHAIDGPFGTAPHFVATMLYRAFASGDAAGHAGHAISGRAERTEGGSLLRDIFGDPFHPLPPLASSMLAWENGLVVRLAEAAYQERELPSGHLDNARLAVLADALEDAGCTDDRLLAHLRSPGPHVRGCVGVDAVLGRA